MTELKYAPVLAPVTAMPKRGSPGSGAAASRAGTAIPVGVGDKVDTIGVEDTGVFVGVAVLVALGGFAVGVGAEAAQTEAAPSGSGPPCGAGFGCVPPSSWPATTMASTAVASRRTLEPVEAAVAGYVEKIGKDTRSNPQFGIPVDEGIAFRPLVAALVIAFRSSSSHLDLQVASAQWYHLV